MSRPFFNPANTLALLLGLSLLVMGAFPFYRALQSQEWRSTDGVVSSSRVIPTGALGFGIALSYEVEMVYLYQVGGQQYKGRRFEFGTGSHAFFLESFAQRVVERYPDGKTLLVFYNPRQPGDAVLERSPSLGSSLFWIVLGMVLMAVGAFKRFAESWD